MKYFFKNIKVEIELVNTININNHIVRVSIKNNMIKNYTNEC